MNRISADSENFKLLRLLDEFTKSRKISFADKSNDDAFLSFLAETINRHRDRQTLVHGLRIQSLFAYMIASLGKCLHIGEEDLGDYYSNVSNISRPDFRVILNSGEHLFVEVKNFFPSNPKNSFKINQKYLQSLMRYADLHRIKLKFAIYWAKWRTWTLTDPQHFKQNGNEYYINLGNAAQQNEMNIFGDYLLATIPPLSIKFETETIERKNQNEMVVEIRSAYFLANGKRITDKTEKKIASFLLFYGRWNCIEQPAEMENGLMKSFEMQSFPNEEVVNPDYDFQMLGNLSEMLTNQYNLMTTDNGKVKTIDSNKQPINIPEMIPSEFKGDILKLWRFTIKPKD